MITPIFALMKIAIVGTGNVAWHLGLAFENAGQIVTAIAGRDRQKVELAASTFYNAKAIIGTDLSSVPADIAIICVSDDAIEEVAQHLSLPQDCILAHSSGTKPLSSLGYAQTTNIGVFYPLQTFTKNKKVDFSSIPICIEADNRNSRDKLKSLASTISNTVAEISSKERAILHLSAVFASNFSNHMLTIAKGIMDHSDMSFELLKPLITETINKSLSSNPEFAQTGPAKRGDLATLDKQFQALSADPDTAELYKMISQHILDYYSE